VKTYDEDFLVATLSQISKAGMAAFACSCAQRSVGALEDFLEKNNPQKINLGRESLDLLWKAILEDKSLSWPDSITQTILDQVAAPASIAHPELYAWAEDAAASLCYAALALKSGDSQNAGWAARRVFDMAFYAAENQTKSSKLEVLDSCEVVQRELERQAQDLEMLLQADEPATYRALRERAASVDILSELLGGSQSSDS
jgi:hypothetical protein